MKSTNTNCSKRSQEQRRREVQPFKKITRHGWRWNYLNCTAHLAISPSNHASMLRRFIYILKSKAIEGNRIREADL